MKDNNHLAVKSLLHTHRTVSLLLSQWQPSQLSRDSVAAANQRRAIKVGAMGLALSLIVGCSGNDTSQPIEGWQDAEKAGVIGYGDADKIILDDNGTGVSRHHTSKYIQLNNTASESNLAASKLSHPASAVNNTGSELNNPVGESAAVLKARQSINRNRRHQSQEEADEIREKLTNSYARLAAKSERLCPKLLQKDVDSNVIRRSNDVMIDDHCDYYIYPQPGQLLQVISSSDQIDTLLIAPKLHDFANGGYRIQSAQKHVIRLSYDGATHKPNSMRYSISVIVEE